MAQRNSGDSNSARSAGFLVLLGGFVATLAVSTNAPLFDSAVWYWVAIGLVAVGSVLFFYDLAFPHLPGVRRLREENESLQRDKRELEREAERRRQGFVPVQPDITYNIRADRVILMSGSGIDVKPKPEASGAPTTQDDEGEPRESP